MNNNFQYAITLPASEEILKVQLGQTVGEYGLGTLRLEYENVDSMNLAQQVSNLYSVG